MDACNFNAIQSFNSEYVVQHHGVRGQKWGIRRYQNADGSLTEEGRRHYGMGPTKRIAPNTIEKIKSGAKTGAIVGTIRGAIEGAAMTNYALAFGANPAVAVGLGVGYYTGRLVRGVLVGTAVGTIWGAKDTSDGKKYIREHDAKLNEMKYSKLKE